MLPSALVEMSRLARLWMLAWACSACTPEAVEVDPPPLGGGGSPNECAPVQSPRAGCSECLEEKCAPEVAACDDTDCTCRRFGAELGQINCLLACPDIRPGTDDSCARECGFDAIRDAEPGTRALWECMLNVPGGPPACMKCVGRR